MLASAKAVVEKNEPCVYLLSSVCYYDFHFFTTAVFFCLYLLGKIVLIEAVE